jgi:hypothetical protein
MMVEQISVQANLRFVQVKVRSAGRSQNYYRVIQDFIDEKKEEYEEMLEDAKGGD